MKKNLLLIFACISILNIRMLHAQNVAINSTGDAPNASAMLDVQSTTKGMLIPRMSTAQRTAIASPATGLLVFDNITGSFWYKSPTGWTELADNSGSIWSKQDTSVYLNHNENVGIGTNRPVVRLQVENGTDVTAATGGFIQLGASSSANLALDNNEMQARNNGSASDLSIQADGGNVGIGTKIPEVRLQVSNGTDVSASGGGYLQLGAGTLPNLAFDNNEIQARNDGNTSPLYLQHDGGDVIIGASSASSTSNLNIANGKLIKAGTGNFNMMPLCYGNINANGTIYNATPNVSVIKGSNGKYTIKCPGVTLSTTVLASLTGALAVDETITANYISGHPDEIQVYVYDFVLDQGYNTSFSFVLYNP